MKNLSLGLFLFSLISLNSNAAQTGGTFVPPPGADLSHWAVPLSVNCDTSPAGVSVQGGLGNQVVILSPVFKTWLSGPSSLDILSKNVDADRDSMLRIQSGNEIQIRTDASAPWLSIGQYSERDIEDYCTTLNAWKALPPPRPEYPVSGRFSIELHAGVRFEISRSAEWSLCLPKLFEGGRHRNLDYRVKITDPSGQTQTFKFVEEMLFGTDADGCKNWKQAPWVEQR